ncbi:MAG TPA: histidine kinase, partial [Vicinamibacteria bacterium]
AGTLWLTTAGGVVQGPPGARAPDTTEPRPQLIRVAVSGRVVDPTRPLEVPHGTNEVALEVSALLYRDPAALQYRIRLGPEASWSLPARASRIQLMDVPSGSYHAEISASAGGAAWTAPRPLFQFHVPTPWHRQRWVWAAAAALVLAAGAAIQRARSAVRLRLERQRTQIALDLHDEMGSGLGSIRVLAGLAARDALDAEKRRVAAARIERTSRDLGQALTAIVWSLRRGQPTLRDLCMHLAERGHELFADESAAFEADFPAEWPAATLPLPARRNLQLIFMEALHNAAKHARAQRVVLGASGEEGPWRLWVEDDGVGLGVPPTGTSMGHGLPGMAERAQNIGATLQVGRARGSLSGTRIEITLPPARFPPAAGLGPRRLDQLREAWRRAWRTSRS